jgi:hypothetical protein
MQMSGMIKMKRRQFAIVVISAGLLLLLDVYLIIPAQQERQKSQAVEVQLTQQLALARQRVMQQGLTGEQSQRLMMDDSLHLLTDISILSQINHLNLQSVARLQEKNKIKLQLTGDYSRMLMFMSALSYQDHVLSVNDFAIKSSKNNELQLAIDITKINPSGKLLILQSPQVVAMNDVFCHTGSLKVSAAESVFTFPLQQIKMVGYMSVSGTLSAFVKLPDGTEHQVEYGSMLGVEKARVIEILNDQLKLNSLDGKTHTITMQRLS